MSDSRLKNYALTAGGTAVLAAASPATADIITGSVVNPIPASTGTWGQLNGETLFSFAGVAILASNNDSASQWGNTNGSTQFAGAKIRGSSGSNAIFQAVSAGATIDENLGSNKSSKAVNPKAANLRNFQSSSVVSSISFGGLGTGNEQLVAFVLIGESETNYYGWINYTLSFSEGSYGFTINSWAYNDVSGQGIIAGQNTAAGSSAVPGLGGLAALAIGAAGLRSRRQRIA